MMFYVGVFLFGIGFAALNIVPPMACRQAFGQKDYANIFSMVATGLNVFSGFSALIYAQIFDITGSFAGCFYLIIGFYVVTLICSLVIVPMAVAPGRRSKLDRKRESHSGPPSGGPLALRGRVANIVAPAELA